MKTVHVKLKNNGYPIFIGDDIIKRTSSLIKKSKLGRDAIVITHPHINRMYGKKLAKSLRSGGNSVKFIEVPQGEKSKSASVAFKVTEKIARFDALKQPFLVAFGGGVIGDLAGFVAAVYKRGIPYIQIPTTLLAQIDSAIGGKTAVDLPVGKNLVGAFYQPKAVISDISLLKSLPRRQLKNGYAEAIKYGIIKDHALFAHLERKKDILFSHDTKFLSALVTTCSQIKARVVERDEKEVSGLRAILNFGHTMGHAIEAAGKFKTYQHGEAIGLGMRIAADISHRLGMLSAGSVKRVNALITHVGLPTTIKKVTLKSIFNHVKHDKKFKAGKNRLVLASRIGKVQLVEGVDWEIVRSATQAFMSSN